MKHYDYIIIGGGMTGSSALMGIRKNDPNGSIAMFSSEAYPPYNRPPLSKGLWGKMKIEDIARPIEKYHVDLFLENPIDYIDREMNYVVDNNNDKYGYAKILLATGGDPIRLPDSPPDILSYKTIEDFKHLRRLAEEKDRFCVIGGGFIGSEIAAALCKIGKEVTLIFPETGISSRIFPENLSLFLNRYYKNKGVQVLPGRLVEDISKDNNSFIVQTRLLQTKELETFSFDGVVLGIGIKPNIQLAIDAGLEVNNGIIVNEYLQTTIPNIFAAGDVANFYNVNIKQRVRVEHEDNANQMGLQAGLNMSGTPAPYHHFPFFYSDLFDLGYEAVGELSKVHQIVETWIEPYQKGTLFYLDNKRIKGLVFWNLWGKIEQGRELIKSGRYYSEVDLKSMFHE